jgi:hypothetical protein
LKSPDKLKKKKDDKSSKKKRDQSPPVSDTEFDDKVGSLATPALKSRNSGGKPAKDSPKSPAVVKVGSNLVEEIRELKIAVKKLQS